MKVGEEHQYVARWLQVVGRELVETLYRVRCFAVPEYLAVRPVDEQMPFPLASGGVKIQR